MWRCPRRMIGSLTLIGLLRPCGNEIHISYKHGNIVFLVSDHPVFCLVLLRQLTPLDTILMRDEENNADCVSTNTGFFEEAQYRYNGNASNPSCIQAVIFWQHGTYTLNNNGSITLLPFASDGRIQVQDPCAAVTNVITYYNQQVSLRSFLPHPSPRFWDWIT